MSAMTAYGSAAQVIAAFIAGDELATRPTKAAGACSGERVSRLAATISAGIGWHDLHSYGDLVGCYLIPDGFDGEHWRGIIAVVPVREYHSITTRKHIAALHAALVAAGYVSNDARTEWRKS